MNQNYSVSWWIPSFDEATKFNKSLYNVINATRAVIGRYPWSVRVQIRTNDYTDDVTAIFLSNMVRGFKGVCKDLRIKQVKNLKKAQQEL